MTTPEHQHQPGHNQPPADPPRAASPPEAKSCNSPDNRAGDAPPPPDALTTPDPNADAPPRDLPGRSQFCEDPQQFPLPDALRDDDAPPPPPAAARAPTPDMTWRPDACDPFAGDDWDAPSAPNAPDNPPNQNDAPAAPEAAHHAHDSTAPEKPTAPPTPSPAPPSPPDAQQTWCPAAHDPFADETWDETGSGAPEPAAAGASQADDAPPAAPETPLAPDEHPAVPLPTHLGAPAPLDSRTIDSGKTVALTARGLSGLWDTIALDSSPRSTLKTPRSRPRFTPSMLVDQPATDLRNIAIEGYELLEVLGEGGVGVVYEAVQKSIDRCIAVKMIKSEAGSDAREREKFLAEAIVTGKLDHPNIVPVHDLGQTTEGRPFYTMKCVRGTPWGKRVHELSRAENLRIMLDVCDAVAFAHARGVIHRDLKPDNVMLGEFGEVQLMDWGLGATVGVDGCADQLSGSAAAGGTPAYMAPEMVTGADGPIGVHSDIYLLGAILWEIITGRPPHPGRRVLDCLDNARKNVISNIEETGVLVEIALRAMSTDPAQRYANAREFRAALIDYQTHAESIAMCARSAQLLDDARAAASYDLFARALFGFREAQTIWPENNDALAGIAATQLSYAECAFDKGDLDLALSQLDPHRAEHTHLLHAVRSAQRTRATAQRRLRLLRRAALALTAALLVIVTTAAVLIARAKHAADVARDHAVAAHHAEQEQRKLAEAAETQAVRAREDMEQAVREMIAARSEEERAKAQANAANLVATKVRDELARSGMLLDNSWWAFDAPRAAELQAEAAAALQMPRTQVITLADDVQLELVLIPAGEFVMGSPPTEEGRAADEHLHRVELTQPFYLARHELTNAQFAALTGRPAPVSKGAESGEAPSPRAPLAGVRYRVLVDEVLPALQRYAPAGYRFVLPSEAQWEYACRAGQPTPYHGAADEAGLSEIGWYAENSQRVLHPVGELAANAFGLYDMHGNAAELCRDHYAAATYLEADLADPLGPLAGERPIVRGGSVMNTAAHCRSAYRSFIYEKNVYEFVGVRVALERLPTARDAAVRGREASGPGSE